MFELFQYQFFTNAVLGAIFASISCGFIGTYIVTRRIVFISGGISHASFGGVGIAYFLGINPIIGAASFSLLSALSIEILHKKLDLRKDTLIGMIWSFGMALGIIFVTVTPGYSANLMVYLFGNILTVSSLDILIMAIMAFLIVILFVLFFKIILYISFDEEYAKTLGIPTVPFNFLLMGLVALTIVINIRIVGIIPVISLLTIPQATASLFTKKFKLIIIYAIGFGFISSISGLFISYLLNIPSGATIIFISIIIFILLKIFKILSKKPEKSK